ncbi:hypothetical protein LDB17_06235 [Dysgonomonas sp. Shenzhen-Wh21]|uniref:hypothetical protein n=1 Tax=Dysgonomonas TaxID=156973 RepID=UPI00208F24CD|nr:hypothetical protein [Dysgonomonas mossii]
METILIDEKELRDKLVKKAREMNASILEYQREKESEFGIKPISYVGGLTGVFCSEKWTLENNINNLLAIFHNNFIESIFFQLNTIKQDKTLAIVLRYLQSRGLEEDFAQFKNQVKHTSPNRKNFIPIQEKTELSDK